MTEPRDPLAETPLLVLIHGTGPQQHDEDEVYRHAVDFGLGDHCRSDEGEQWWQTDGCLCPRLDSRIRTKDGRRLTETDLVFRLKWHGDNLETARDAAADTFEALFEHSGRRPLHVIAHSHGGNVARAAIERLARKKQDIARIGTVVSMGTPFFTYSRGFWVRAVLTQASLTGLLLFFGYLCHSAHEAAGGFAASGLSKWILFPAGVLFVILALLTGALLIGLLRKPPRKGRKLRHKIRWFNLCSRNDEAIQLLASLNRPINLLSRFSGKAKPSLVGTALCLAAFGLSFALLSIAIHYLRLDIDPEGVAFVLIWMASGYVLYLWFVTLRQWFSTGTTAVLDSIISSRLRALAFGDDDGDGIVRVSKRPWPNYHDACISLPNAMEVEIEARISAATAGMWAKVRGAIAPNASFLDANFRYLVDEVLTGDELAHTVYYRVDSLVDLIAERLVESGDFVYCDVAPGLPQ